MSKEITRKQAQRQIASTCDPEIIGRFLKHGNSHIRLYAAHKLDQITNDGEGARSIKALLRVVGAVYGGEEGLAEYQALALRLKRSEAARKAAATRAAKRANAA